MNHTHPRNTITAKGTPYLVSSKSGSRDQQPGHSFKALTGGDASTKSTMISINQVHHLNDSTASHSSVIPSLWLILSNAIEDRRGQNKKGQKNQKNPAMLTGIFGPESPDGGRGLPSCFGALRPLLIVLWVVLVIIVATVNSARGTPLCHPPPPPPPGGRQQPYFSCREGTGAKRPCRVGPP